jgi:hypothetical protein
MSEDDEIYNLEIATHATQGISPKWSKNFQFFETEKKSPIFLKLRKNPLKGFPTNAIFF